MSTILMRSFRIALSCEKTFPKQEVQCMGQRNLVPFGVQLHNEKYMLSEKSDAYEFSVSLVNNPDSSFYDYMYLIQVDYRV